MIETINKNIAYLEGLKTKDFIPFPLVEQS